MTISNLHKAGVVAALTFASFVATSATPSPANDPALVAMRLAEADAAQANKLHEAKPPREVRKQKPRAKPTSEKKEAPPKGHE